MAGSLSALAILAVVVWVVTRHTAPRLPTDVPPELIDGMRVFPPAGADLPPAAPLGPLLADRRPQHLAIVSPPEGTLRVGPQGGVSVTFNRPMVAGAAVGAALPASPVWFRPPVRGVAHWSTRSTLVFDPAPETFASIVEARMTLDPTLRSLAHEAVDDDALRTVVFAGGPRVVRWPTTTRLAPGQPMTFEFDGTPSPAFLERQWMLFEQGGGVRSLPYRTTVRPSDVVGHSFVDVALGRTLEPGTVVTLAMAPSLLGGGDAVSSRQFEIQPRARLAGVHCPADATVPSACSYTGVPAQIVEIGEALRVVATAPLATVGIADVRVVPTPPGLRVTSSGPRIELRADWEPDQVYEVRFGPLHEVEGGDLERAEPLAIRSSGVTPVVHAAAGRLLFEPDAPGTLAFSGAHLDHADVEYLPIERGDEVGAAFAPSNPADVPADARWRTLDLAPLAPRARPNRWGRGTFAWFDATADRAASMALVRFDADTTSGDDPPAPLLVQRSDVGIFARALRGGLLVWTTSVSTGAPLAGASIVVGRVNRTAGVAATAQLGAARTDHDGIAWIPWHLRQAPEPMAIVASRDGDRAVLLLDPRNAQGPGVFGLSGQDPGTFSTEGSQPFATLFTDHGVYRPGETVRAKITVRTGAASAMRPLLDGALRIELVSPSSAVPIATQTVPLSAFGTADTTLDLGRQAAVGDYSLNVYRGTALEPLATGSIHVVDYRQPTMRLDADLGATEVTQGDPIVASLSGQYLFGAGVAGGHVAWSLTREGTADHGPAWREYRFGSVDAPGPHGTADSGEDVLDEHGRLEIRPVASVVSSVREAQSLEVTVRDDAGHEIAARRSLTAFPGAFEVGIQNGADEQLPATPLDLGAVLVAHDGHPVEGHAMAARILREAWHGYWERTHAASEDGSDASGDDTYQTRRAQDRTVVQTCALTSAREPVHCTWQATQPGAYVLEASATDEAGHVVTSSRRVYVTGDTAQPDRDPQGGATVTVTPARAMWHVGENVHVAFESPWAGARALITVEHASTVRREVRVVPAGGNEIEFPATADMIPNVTVSVVLVKGRTAPPEDARVDLGAPDSRVGVAEVTVRPAPAPLAVTVTPAAASALPGTDVPIDVSVVDAGGHGVHAEVALYAVDEGVLRLTSYASPDPVAGLFRHRSAWFALDDLRRQLVRRGHLVEEPLPGGDGGGDDAAPVGRDDGERIDPTALWLPHVQTDAGGHAHALLTLPGRVAQYRILAVAQDTGVRAGSATAQVTATRPLVVRPALPRSLTEGDHVLLQAFVHDTTHEPFDAVVRFVINGTPQPEQTVHVAPGADQRVVTAVDPHGETLQVRVEARAGTNHDDYVTTLPVTARGHVVRSQTVGMVHGDRDVTLSFPASTLPRDAQVRLTLATHPFVGFAAAAEVLDPADARDGYETADGVLALASYEAMGAGVRDVHDVAEIHARGAQAVEHLAACANGEGAFEAYPGAGSDARLTVRALRGLLRARRLGWAVPAPLIDRAVDYLVRNVTSLRGGDDGEGETSESSVRTYDVRAEGAMVLAEVGHRDTSDLDVLYNARAEMTPGGLAALALAMDGSDRRRDTVALAAGTGMIQRLRMPRRGGGPPRAPVGSTATLARVLAESCRVPVAWDMARTLASALLALRPDGAPAWSDTESTADALDGLADYGARFRERPLGTVTVTLDGHSWATPQRSAGTMAVELPIERLLHGPHTLHVHADGLVFYALSATTFQALGPADEIARGREMALHRVFEDEAGAPLAPEAHLHVGDRVRVRLFFYADHTTPAGLIVRDRVAGGLEPIDADLDTTPQTALQTLLGAGGDDGADDPHVALARRSVDRVSRRAYFRNATLFHLDEIGAGLWEFTYALRATTPGTFVAPPAEVETVRMFATRARSTAATFTVDP